MQKEQKISLWKENLFIFECTVCPKTKPVSHRNAHLKLQAVLDVILYSEQYYSINIFNVNIKLKTDISLSQN